MPDAALSYSVLSALTTATKPSVSLVAWFEAFSGILRGAVKTTTASAGVKRKRKEEVQPLASGKPQAERSSTLQQHAAPAAIKKPSPVQHDAVATHRRSSRTFTAVHPYAGKNIRAAEVPLYRQPDAAPTRRESITSSDAVNDEEGDNESTGEVLSTSDDAVAERRLRARFMHAMAELQTLGVIRQSKKLTGDVHFERLLFEDIW
jgi:hypothetical protein